MWRVLTRYTWETVLKFVKLVRDTCVLGLSSPLLGVGGGRGKQASVLLDSMHNNIPKHLMYLLPLTTHVLHLSDGCREEICSHSTCGKVN